MILGPDEVAWVFWVPPDTPGINGDEFALVYLKDARKTPCGHVASVAAQHREYIHPEVQRRWPPLEECDETRTT